MNPTSTVFPARTTGAGAVKLAAERPDLELVLVALLVGYHAYLGQLVKRFADDRNTRGHIYYRWLNEAPVLVLVGAVLLVILQPTW